MKHTMKVLTASALLVATSAANAGFVDLFTTDQTFMTDDTLSDGGLSNFQDEVGLDNILGGSRDLGVELVTSNDAENRNASIGVSAGLFSFSVDANATATGIVQWDGGDHSIALDTTGLSDFDLTLGGTVNSFAIDIDTADLDFDFSINAYTDDNNWTTAHLISNISSGIAIISFSDFNNCGLSDIPSGIIEIACAGGANAVDFAHLGALELVITPDGGSATPFSGTLDMSLNSIRTIPEPSVLGLMGAGLFAAGVVSRRRKNKTTAA